MTGWSSGCTGEVRNDTTAKSIPKKAQPTCSMSDEVLLSDIMQRPPVDVWVDVSPVYVAQVMQWQPGTVIRATIKSEVFTVEEKVQEMGWSKEGCEKMLQETGY